MKLLSALVLAALSSSVSAQICEVDMVDRYNRVIQTFRAYGEDHSCMEGMKQCRKAIRLGPHQGGVDCIRAVSQYPQQGPQQPYPYPQQPQQPYPYPGQSEVARMLQPGEQVIYNNASYSVIGTSYNGQVALRSSYGFITQGINRQEVAVTTGCNFSICAQQTIIDISTLSYKTVAGLYIDNKFALKSSYGHLSVVNLNAIAVTAGCVGSYYQQICVGDQVLARDNSYKSVAAIQQDGRLVLKNSYGHLSVNVLPQDLIVTR